MYFLLPRCLESGSTANVQSMQHTKAQSRHAIGRLSVSRRERFEVAGMCDIQVSMCSGFDLIRSDGLCVFTNLLFMTAVIKQKHVHAFGKEDVRECNGRPQWPLIAN